MANGPFGLSPKHVILLVILQCTLQGIIFPLLASFLASERNRPTWFKIYVIWVNVLCLVQTIVHIIQGFDALDPTPPRVILVVMAPTLTATIAAFVQAFFIHRCWRIFKQRALPIIPFLFVSLVSLVSGIMLGIHTGQWLMTGSTDNTKISLALWISSSFVLDFSTTFTTIIYLYRVRRELTNNRNIFNTIWQVMWASAAPPLILMVVVLIGGYSPSRGLRAAPVLAAAITGKFFVLSLMINLVGQGYIRRQFEQPRPADSSSPGQVTSRNVAGGVSDIAFAPVTGNDIELTTSTRSTAFNQVGTLKDGDQDPGLSRVTTRKPCEPTVNHTTHTIQLAQEP